MKRKAGKTTKARQRRKIKTEQCEPPMDSFDEYKTKLRKIMREGGASLLARHKHAQETPAEKVSATEKARKRAKEVVWEQKFKTPRERSREMSRRRQLGLERERQRQTPPKKPKC